MRKSINGPKTFNRQIVIHQNNSIRSQKQIITISKHHRNIQDNIHILIIIPWSSCSCSLLNVTSRTIILIHKMSPNHSDGLNLENVCQWYGRSNPGQSTQLVIVGVPLEMGTQILLNGLGGNQCKFPMAFAVPEGTTYHTNRCPHKTVVYHFHSK